MAQSGACAALARPASAMVPLEELLRRALLGEAPPAPAASAVIHRAAALALRARRLGAALVATAAALLAGVALVVVAAPTPGPATVVEARQLDEPAPVTSSAAPRVATSSDATPAPPPDQAAPSQVSGPAPAEARSLADADADAGVATPVLAGPALRVVDGAGRPVAGAQVFALDAHEHPRPVDLGDPHVQPRITGPDGLVPVAPEAAGYLVRRGLDRAWLDTPDAWPAWATEVRLLGPEEPRPGLTVVTGRVLTPSGPLRDARVRALVSEGSTSFDGTITTDGEGRFVVRDLPPRAWTLWVRPDGWAQCRVALDAKPGAQTVELRLTPACLLQGELVSGADDARLLVWSDDPGRWDMGSGEDGRYQFTGLAPGSYWVEAELPGLVGRRVRVDVREPVTRGPPLRLDGGVTVTGRLTEGLHWLVGLTLVDVRPLRPLEAWGTRSDADGRFAVRGVLPGRHRLEVSRPVLGQESVEVATVEVAGQDVDLGDVAVGPAPDVKDVLVQGLVRDVAGAPVAGAEVHVMLPFSSTSAVSGPDGRFLLGCGVTAGRHALWARAADGRVTAALVEVDVGPRGLDGVSLVVAPGGTIVGRIVASEARRNADLLCVEAHPASDLEAKREWPRFQATPRPDDGSFRLVGLPPGRTRVTLLSQGRERWVDVRAGATVDVGELDLRAEVATLDLRLATDERARVTARWRDAAGAEVSTSQQLQAGAARLEWVQVGAVELTVEHRVDRKLRTFTVPLDVPLAGLRLELDLVARGVRPR